MTTRREMLGCAAAGIASFAGGSVRKVPTDAEIKAVAREMFFIGIQAAIAADRRPTEAQLESQWRTKWEESDNGSREGLLALARWHLERSV